MKRKQPKTAKEWELDDVKHGLYESHVWGRLVHATHLLLANALITTLIQRKKERRTRN